MSTTAATALVPARAQSVRSRHVSLEKFFERYSGKEDGYQYEWNNGLIEKTIRNMNRDQFLLLQKLMRLFTQTTAYKEMGELISEVDMYLPVFNRTRRADIAYLSGQDMKNSRDGKPAVSPFVVEIISKNDQINDLEDKKAEYFASGVRVLWVILPHVRKVEVYRSLKAVEICTDQDICSADPVLPDYKISVNSLFDY